MLPIYTIIIQQRAPTISLKLIRGHIGWLVYVRTLRVMPEEEVS